VLAQSITPPVHTDGVAWGGKGNGGTWRRVHHQLEILAPCCMGLRDRNETTTKAPTHAHICLHRHKNHRTTIMRRRPRKEQPQDLTSRHHDCPHASAHDLSSSLLVYDNNRIRIHTVVTKGVCVESRPRIRAGRGVAQGWRRVYRTLRVAPAFLFPLWCVGNRGDFLTDNPHPQAAVNIAKRCVACLHT
jgi:hypothetical protein